MGVVSVKATEREPFWRFALAILAGGVEPFYCPYVCLSCFHV
ncbi:hypothetical protein GXSOP10_10825 [Armatimonadetes bacterium GXS]|nr:hypothetical protein GXSOP10_10825 [Armatimonadetes bacterium GXS]